jgi:hypothetical protein
VRVTPKMTPSDVDVRNTREVEQARGEFLAQSPCAPRAGLSGGRPNTAPGQCRPATNEQLRSQFSEAVEAMSAAGPLPGGLQPILP